MKTTKLSVTRCAKVLRLLVSSGMALAATGGEAATLSGKVLDDGTAKGLGAVFVTVTLASGGQRGPVITDGNGEYKVPDIPPGTVKISYSTGGYLLDPTERSCTVTEPEQEKRADDVSLFAKEKAASPEYLRAVADRIVLLANGNTEIAAQRLAWYAALPIPYSAKAEIAKSVAGKDARLAATPVYAAFKDVDIAQVKMFEGQLEMFKMSPESTIKWPMHIPAATVKEVMKSAVEATPLSERVKFEKAMQMGLETKG